VVITARIFGDQVGSTAPVFLAFLAVHVLAGLTAFYVDNGPRLRLWDHLPVITFWPLPSAIGAPITARAVIHARARAGPLPGRTQGRARS
jgi:hypothetical protein